MKRTAAVATAVAIMMMFAFSAAAQSPDSELGDLYYRQAERLQLEGRLEESLRVVEVGLQHDDLNADLLTLYAELLLQDPAETRYAVELLERAVLYGTFERVSPDAGLSLLASLLVRTGDYRSALGWIADHARDRAAPDLLYHEARAHLRLQQYEAADRRIALGLRRYPEDPRFMRLAVERDPLPGFSVARLLDEYRAARNEREYLRALRHYAGSLEPGEKQRRRLEQYFEYGGTSPQAVSEYLRYSDDPQAELERFRTFGGFETKEHIARFFESLPDGAAREALALELQTYSGVVYGDRDDYGYPRERISLERGQVARYQFDRDRDGRFEHDLWFSESLPRFYRREQSNGVVVRIEYHAYPEVASVVRGEPDENEFRFVMVPGRFRFPALGFGENWFSDYPQAIAELSLAFDLELPRPAVLTRHAARIEERRPDTERAHEITYLDDGEVYRVTADNNRDGRIDLIVEYSGNEPLFGLRDSNGDGYFESFKRYHAGVLAEVAVDENRDGVYTYFEEPGPPLRVSWDLLHDGRIEVRDTYENDVLVRREYHVAPSVWPDVREISPWSLHGTSE